MKRWAVGLAVFAVALAVGHADGSIVVNVTYTADNVTAAVVQEGAGPTYYPIFPSGNSANWKLSDTISLTLDYGRTYQLIFRVFNDTDAVWVPAENPGAFLAEIVGDVTGPKLTSAAWEYAVDTGEAFGAYPADFNTLAWSNVTEWAFWGTSSNNGGDNIWTGGNGGQPIAGISTEAKWVWGPHNGEDLAPGLYPEENFLWIRTQVTTPIPEPSTFIIWSLLGALGITVGWWRRRRAM